MSRHHRGLSALLVTALAAGGIALVPAAPAVAATLVTDWASLQAAVNTATEDVAVELGASIDNPSGQNLSVPVGVTVTLDLGAWNLTINGLGNYAPAIRVPSGAGLVIDGTTGRLTANGGASAAAIGGKSGNNQNGESAGSITIRGGDVRATAAGAVPSRGAGGAGIGGGGGGNFSVAGGGDGGNGGAITITGGIVRATSASTYTVRDGAGIGGGGGSLGTSGNGRAGSGAQVTITGGTVIAVGGENSSGIGSGGAYQLGAAGSITVQGVAAAGSVTNGGRRSAASSYTRPATIAATGTPADQVFRAARAGNNYSVRIEYPAAVVFDANGGTGLTPLALEVGSTIPEPDPAPTRVGHTFAGWYADAALTTAWNFADDVTDSELTTLYASWTVNSYPVTFVSNGGSAVPPQPVDYGTTVTAPAAPTREGYSFVGWFADAALTTTWDFATDVMPASGITLYAKWSINSYDVAFVSNGGSAVPTQSVVYDTHVAEPSDPTREGYTFTGWFADAGLTSAWDFASGVVPSHAITLHAGWSINSYLVSFAANGGSAVPPQSEVFDTLVTEPATPTRDGHTFIGWFADAALTSAWDFAADRVPASAITLYAKWSINSYTVSFDAAGGTAVADQTVEYGSPIAPPAPPARTGYVFTGWFAGASEWGAERPVLADVVLTARWTPIVVEVVAGSQQALIRWDAMALPEGPVTSYTATVEPGGASCTATSLMACAVTGLAPGAYSVVVTAHWPASSAVSDAVVFDVVELTMPSDAPAASTPAIALTLLSGGSPVTAAIPDARLTVVGSGFVPGSSVELFVYSDPEPLGTTTADADGGIAVGIVIPADLELGAHTLVARGFSSDGLENGYGVAALAVVAPALSSTGVDAVGGLLVPLLVILVLLGLGAAGILRGRRRTARTTEIGG